MADLWIRTQDRNSLLKVDNINCCGTKIYTNNHEAAMFIDLGEYDTEERAKEVLNEIQDFIVPKVFVPQELRFMSRSGFMAICKDWKYEDFKEISIGVYSMPRD